MTLWNLTTESYSWLFINQLFHQFGVVEVKLKRQKSGSYVTSCHLATSQLVMCNITTLFFSDASLISGCKIKMGLSALSSPTNGLHGNSLDRIGNRRLSTPDDLDGSRVWHPRPVDRESMARITQYFTQASLSTHGRLSTILVSCLL